LESQAGGVSFRDLACLPTGRAFERLNRPSLVEANHGVELIRQSGAEVVAQTFGLGAVDYSDGPLIEDRLPGAVRSPAFRPGARLRIEIEPRGGARVAARSGGLSLN
jgi:hypothetical protein